jgi:hypothetical protein
MVFWGIWKFFSKLVKDVMSHIYGKILVPLLALLVIAYLVQLFTK